MRFATPERLWLSHALEVFKSKLDGAWSNLVGAVPAQARGWNEMRFKVLSNSNQDSVVFPEPLQETQLKILEDSFLNVSRGRLDRALNNLV